MQKNVILVDFSQNGHHATYAKLFKTILDNLGVVTRLEFLPSDFLENCRREGRFQGPIVFWRRLSRVLAPQTKDLVLFLYWDDVRPFWLGRGFRSILFPYVVAGIWMNTWGFRGKRAIWTKKDAYKRYPFLSEQQVRLFVLDEKVVSILVSYGHEGVFFLPELTDTTLSIKIGSILEKTRIFKGSRKLLLLIGVLSGVKNIELFLKIAGDLTISDWAFAMIGEGSSQLQKLEVKSNLETRLLCISKRIPSEEEYNSLISEADLLWGVYNNWEGSSNLVIKAGLLGKPVIVSDGFLSAERVRKYGLGYVVSQDSPSEIISILKNWGQFLSTVDNKSLAATFSSQTSTKAIIDFLDCFAQSDESATRLRSFARVAFRVLIAGRYVFQKLWDSAKRASALTQALARSVDIIGLN